VLKAKVEIHWFHVFVRRACVLRSPDTLRPQWGQPPAVHVKVHQREGSAQVIVVLLQAPEAYFYESEDTDILDKHKERLYPRPFDCILLSGDSTFACDRKGFEAAEAFVSEIAGLAPHHRVVILPGNHDVMLVKPVRIRNLYLPASKDEAEAPLRSFLTNIQKYTSATSEWLTGYYREERPGLPGLYIEAMNSCRVERRDAQGWGFIGVDQLYQLGHILIHGRENDPSWKPPKPGDIVLAVTHHNPLPLWDIGLEEIRNPPRRRKVSFVMDAASLLSFLSDLGLMVLLHGHAHTRSVKVVDGYNGAGVPRSSPLWVMGTGSFGIRLRDKDEGHHLQILEIGTDDYGHPELRYQDLMSDYCGRDTKREWRMAEDMGKVPLTSAWNPESARKEFDLHKYERYSIGLLMEVANSWSILRTKKLEPAGWEAVFTGICHRTMEAGARLGITSLTISGIHKILETIFDDPPSEFEICNVRLEQIILDRWMKT
jgi:hypothetical protein